MISIYFISGHDRIMNYTITPILQAQSVLRERGIEVYVKNRILSTLSGDIIILISKHIFNIVKECSVHGAQVDKYQRAQGCELYQYSEFKVTLNNLEIF